MSTQLPLTFSLQDMAQTVDLEMQKEFRTAHAGPESISSSAHMTHVSDLDSKPMEPILPQYHDHPKDLLRRDSACGEGRHQCTYLCGDEKHYG